MAQAVGTGAVSPSKPGQWFYWIIARSTPVGSLQPYAWATHGPEYLTPYDAFLLETRTQMSHQGHYYRYFWDGRYWIPDNRNLLAIA